MSASGTLPRGSSPKSVNFALENCNDSLMIGALSPDCLIILFEKHLNPMNGLQEQREMKHYKETPPDGKKCG